VVTHYEAISCSWCHCISRNVHWILYWYLTGENYFCSYFYARPVS
jgi:hypothetical protein